MLANTSGVVKQLGVPTTDLFPTRGMSKQAYGASPGGEGSGVGIGMSLLNPAAEVKKLYT